VPENVARQRHTPIRFQSAQPVTTLMSTEQEHLARLIVERLGRDEATLCDQFARSTGDVGVRHVAIADLLPDDIARRIQAAFPVPEALRLVDSFRDRKYTGKNCEKFDPLMADITVRNCGARRLVPNRRGRTQACQ